MQAALLREDAIENHLHAIAGAEAAPPALANDLVRVFAPRVAVVAQRVDRNQAFDKQVGEFDEEAVLGGVEHQRGKFLANPVLHEAHLFPLHQLALGFGSAALGLAGFLGDLRQLGFGNRRLSAEAFAWPQLFSMVDDDALQRFVGVRPG